MIKQQQKYSVAIQSILHNEKKFVFLRHRILLNLNKEWKCEPNFWCLIGMRSKKNMSCVLVQLGNDISTLCCLILCRVPLFSVFEEVEKIMEIQLLILLRVFLKLFNCFSWYFKIKWSSILFRFLKTRKIKLCTFL